MAITINGSGTIAGISAGGLNDDAIAIADLSATGTASATTFLRGDNAWAEAGGGKLLQVVSSIKTDTFTKGTSTDWLDIDGTDQAGSGSVWCCKITPSAATSKVLILATLGLSTTYYGAGRLVRDSTAIGLGESAGSRTQGTFASGYASTGMVPTFSVPLLDSPSSTSELTYKIQVATPYSASYGLSVNVPMTGDADGAYITRPVSVLTLIEVGA